MDIHPQGGLHVGVAQDFGEGFDNHAVFDAPCGAGVAQDVEIPHRDFQPLQEAPESVLQRSRLHWPVAAREQVAAGFQRVKQRKHFRRQGNHSLRAFAFRRLNHRLRAASVVDTVGRSLYVHGSAGKINV